ncbi:MAG: DNA recombination protein RmuC [Pseudomonadota bacterium]
MRYWIQDQAAAARNADFDLAEALRTLSTSDPAMWAVAVLVFVLFFLVIFILMWGRAAQARRIDAERLGGAYADDDDELRDADGAPAYFEATDAGRAAEEELGFATADSFDPDADASQTAGGPDAEPVMLTPLEPARPDDDPAIAEDVDPEPAEPRGGVFASLFAGKRETARPAAPAPSPAEPAELADPIGRDAPGEPVRFNFDRDPHAEPADWTAAAGPEPAASDADLDRRMQAAFSRFNSEEGAADLEKRLARIVEERVAALGVRLEGANQRLAQTVQAAAPNTPATTATRGDFERLAAQLERHIGQERAALRDALGELTDKLSGQPLAAGGVDNMTDVEALKADVAAIRTALTAGAQPAPSLAFAPSVQLADVMRSTLPADAFTLRAALSNGRTADGLVRLPGSAAPLPIDARFPVEAWHRLVDARAQEGGAAAGAENDFRRAVLRHIVDISERLIDAPETADSAIMFTPSESIHTELHTRFHDVVQDSYRARVWIVSPTTLMATLHAVRAVLLAARPAFAAPAAPAASAAATDDGDGDGDDGLADAADATLADDTPDGAAPGPAPVLAAGDDDAPDNASFDDDAFDAPPGLVGTRRDAMRADFIQEGDVETVRGEDGDAPPASPAAIASSFFARAGGQTADDDAASDDDGAADRRTDAS